MKIKKKNLYLGILVIGLIILIYVMFFNSSGGGVPGGGWNLYKKEVTCQVKLVNPLLSLGKLQIDEATCNSRKTLICNPFNILAVTSTSGNLFLESEGISNSIGVSVSGLPGFNSKDYSISVCGMSDSANSGVLSVRINNEITSTEEVYF